MIKTRLWDEILRNHKCYGTAQKQRVACDSVRWHIYETLHALRKEAHSLPRGERRSQLFEEINDLYDVFCEIGA